MFSLPHLFLILLIVVLIFGAGKLPRVMGDVGKGIRSLREGLKGEEDKVETMVKTDDQKIKSDAQKVITDIEIKK